MNGSTAFGLCRVLASTLFHLSGWIPVLARCFSGFAWVWRAQRWSFWCFHLVWIWIYPFDETVGLRFCAWTIARFERVSVTLQAQPMHSRFPNRRNTDSINFVYRLRTKSSKHSLHPSLCLHATLRLSPIRATITKKATPQRPHPNTPPPNTTTSGPHAQPTHPQCTSAKPSHTPASSPSQYSQHHTSQP